MGKWTDDDIPYLEGKRALVTGAASGIGFETAMALAAHGAEVILADIDRQGGERAASSIRGVSPHCRAEFRALDISNQGAVQFFSHGLMKERRPLDILINNAGIQPLSERRVTSDGFEQTFGIGHLGHFALTGLLLPLLSRAAAPRVVTVSSLVHKAGRFDWDDLQMERGYTSQRPYNQTKLANLLFAAELQRRAQAANSPLLSLVVHPGVARTSIGANRRRQGKFHLADHFVSLALAMVFPLLGQPARMGAWPALYAATSGDVVPGGFYGPDGIGGFKGHPILTRPAPAGRDIEAADKLWQVSERLTGIRFDWTPAASIPA